MSTVSLRVYQLDALDKIRDAYKRGIRAVLYVLPPGGGKTVTFAAICKGAAARGNKVLILCHRAELIEQISDALTAQDVPHGYISASHDYRPGQRVYVASVFTLAKRLDWFIPDLVIIDEAHHTTAATTWGRILTAYPRARRLGVTASPIRLSGEGLSDFFEELIEGPTYQELTDAGFLTPCKVFAPPTISTDSLHTRFGEYIQNEVAAAAGRPSVTGDCIEHYQKHTPGKRAVVFDVSVSAAKERAAAFRAAGFRADCIDGSLDPAIRRNLVSDFRSGRLQVLTSCDLISEGFDLPAIEVGICLRPTQSLGLFLQQTGRTLRPFEGKSVSIIFDHAGNCHRFGLPTEARSWSLSGVDEVSHARKPVDSVRVCAQCFAANSARAMVCSACGNRFAARPRRVVEKEGELAELSAEELILARQRREKRQTQGRTGSLEGLIAIGRQRGMKNPEGWAKHVMEARRAKGRA
jgi:DNA repair protein RadD